MGLGGQMELGHGGPVKCLDAALFRRGQLGRDGQVGKSGKGLADSMQLVFHLSGLR
jgi:hypothetical protein